VGDADQHVRPTDVSPDDVGALFRQQIAPAIGARGFYPRRACTETLRLGSHLMFAHDVTIADFARRSATSA